MTVPQKQKNKNLLTGFQEKQVFVEWRLLKQTKIGQHIEDQLFMTRKFASWPEKIPSF